MADFWVPRTLQPGVALHRGVAGESGELAGTPGPRSQALVQLSIAHRGADRAVGAGRSLARDGLVALAFFLGVSGAQAQVVSTRIWPAKDYTRVTLESKAELKYQLFSVKDPERLVLDIEGLEIGPALTELHGKVAEGDPYIDKLRVGRNRPGVVRLVIDLKAEVKPQLFTLKPVGEYGHRLVLDLYPLVPIDPLAALIEADGKLPKVDERRFVDPVPASPPPAAPARPKVARLATIVIDPGHGGEDPGARGRLGSREKDVTLTIAKRLKELIDAEPDMRAVLTRDGDFYVPLQTRVDKARRVKADLFVSVHADAFIRANARGSSVFALGAARDLGGRPLAGEKGKRGRPGRRREHRRQGQVPGADAA